jgi:hypothetical protein
MMKVFASGSCRLVTSIKDGYRKIEPIHSMFYNFVGINFLGKLHNTKQHIQFIRWIKDEIEIPQTILSSFLTSYSNLRGIEDKQLLPSKKEKIKNSFNYCDCYIFEICSLKLYEKDGYQVQHEFTNDYTCVLQSETDLYNDLEILQGLIPKGKKILFQTHFRPNIIYNVTSKIIDNREIIYNVVNNFCNTHENTYLYDPSVLLNTDKSLYDGDTHFNNRGHEICFNYIYDNFLQKLGV